MYRGMTPEVEEKLSDPNTKAGRLQRACLNLIAEHVRDGAIPTSIRFLFYELEGRGVIPKKYYYEDGREKPRKPSQDVSEAMTHLREEGIVPWAWLVDETRTLHSWGYADTVYRYVEDKLPHARIDAWEKQAPPLILCESRSLAGVLKDIAGAYLAPITATNGQTGGFLHTDVGPLVKRAHEDGVPVPVRVLYLGDLDLSGGHIEENTKKVLEKYAPLEWRRVAMTEEQARERNLEPMRKTDNRYRPPRPYEAIETEALGQVGTQDVLRDALDELLPQPLGEIRKAEKERRVQVQVREALSPLHVNGSFPNPYNIPEEVVDHLVTEADVGVSMIVERLLLTAVPQRSAVRAELRRQVARRLLRED